MGLWGRRARVQAQPALLLCMLHCRRQKHGRSPWVVPPIAGTMMRGICSKGVGRVPGQRTVSKAVCTLNCSNAHTALCALSQAPSPHPHPPTHCWRATGSRRSRRQRAHHDGGAQHREEVLRAGRRKSRARGQGSNWRVQDQLTPAVHLQRYSSALRTSACELTTPARPATPTPTPPTHHTHAVPPPPNQPTIPPSQPCPFIT